MTKENAMFALELCVLGWAVFTLMKNKKSQYLYTIILFIGMMLWWYPFYLPVTAGFTIWSALGAWIVFKEGRQLKKSSLRTVGLMLVAFTIVFLMQALIEMKIL